MKTLIEFYDREPLLNVLSIITLKPECVVFLMGRPDADEQEHIRRFFKGRNETPRLVFYTIREVGIESAYTALEDARQAMGDVVLDVTGGRDDFLFAAGMFCQARHVPAIMYDVAHGRYRELYDYPQAAKLGEKPSLTVADFLRLAGGEMIRHGHIGDHEMTDDMLRDIDAVWKVYIDYQERWARHVLYLQYASHYPVDALTVSAPMSIRGNDGRVIRANEEIIRRLCEANILHFERTEGELRIRYRNALLKRCLADVGIWLELYTYLEAKRSQLFDDVKISVVIDWNGRSDVSGTLNELDVVLTRGVSPIFISCKSGTASVTAVNEIHVLKSMFGGAFAKAVLVTMDTPSQNAPALYRRAVDLGVHVVEGPEIIAGKLGERLHEIAGC